MDRLQPRRRPPAQAATARRQGPANRARARAVMALLLPCLAAGSSLGGKPAAAQQPGYGQTMGTTPLERQIYGTGSSGSGGAPLDVKNPLDLINQLRRSTALDDATPPSTAVDRALRDLDATAAPAAPASRPAGSTPARTGLQGP